jgi:hypothetical protein
MLGRAVFSSAVTGFVVAIALAGSIVLRRQGRTKRGLSNRQMLAVLAAALVLGLVAGLSPNATYPKVVGILSAGVMAVAAVWFFVEVRSRGLSWDARRLLALALGAVGFIAIELLTR